MVCLCGRMREFALAGGGPTLIHVETMRGCGHAHHHDDLYLGAPSGNPPGYVDRDLLEYWVRRIRFQPMRSTCSTSASTQRIWKPWHRKRMTRQTAHGATEAMPWPEPDSVRIGVTALTDADAHEDHLDRLRSGPRQPDHPLRWSRGTKVECDHRAAVDGPMPTPSSKRWWRSLIAMGTGPSSWARTWRSPAHSG